MKTNKSNQQETHRLTDQEFLRYNRHVMVDSIGETGQIMLKNANVLIVGIGGLGCPVAQYLVASGVGSLTLVDHDNVELSNLQRQILFAEADIGKSKAEVAKTKLNQLNPLVNIKTIKTDIQSAVTAKKLSWLDLDLVLDCSDNKETRLFVNQHCLDNQVPLVSGAATQQQGQLVSFDYATERSPCYECLFPSDQPSVANNCQSAGVMSTLLAVIGGWQANLAILTLLNKNPKLNKLITINALTLQQNEYSIKQDSSCSVHSCNDKTLS